LIASVQSAKSGFSKTIEGPVQIIGSAKAGTLSAISPTPKNSAIDAAGLMNRIFLSPSGDHVEPSTMWAH
jgi:hypothetical protein